jgi:hypothetical protein
MDRHDLGYCSSSDFSNATSADDIAADSSEHCEAMKQEMTRHVECAALYCDGPDARALLFFLFL